MSIVVTGATGHLGRIVVERLLERGVAAEQVVAGGRRPEVLDDLASRGVRTARIDYDEPATVEAVLGEGDTVLLVSGSEVGRRVEQHGAVVDAAVRAGVRRIVYTSVLGGDSPLVLAPEHVATEALIRDSGLSATILRNGWYTENYVPVLQQAAATGEVVASVADGRVASATRADYAEAAVVVLTEDGHENATYELPGDHAWTHDELAEVIGGLLGRPVTYRRVSPEEHYAILQETGLDDATAGFLVTMDANIRDGLLAGTPGELSRLIGRPTTPLVDALRPYAG